MRIYSLARKVGNRYKPTGCLFFDHDEALKSLETSRKYSKDKFRIDIYEKI